MGEMLGANLRSIEAGQSVPRRDLRGIPSCGAAAIMRPQPLVPMTFLARLRSSSRGFLVWMLLAAYVCTPLAAWAAQPGAQAVVVPYCMGQGPSQSGTRWPRRVVLRFTSHAQVTANAIQFALPATTQHAFESPETSNFDATLRREPIAATHLAWRPPPRAPPSSPRQV